jgi:two-component system, cell cycle response regulator DivK
LLVVEDFDELYELYSEFLAGVGFAVEGSSTDEQVIAEAQRVRPDVIIMDLPMPRANAWEAIQRLKAEPATRHIPVIALTGHAQPHFADLARQAGAETVLRKPCRLDELLREIERLLCRDSESSQPLSGRE